MGVVSILAGAVSVGVSFVYARRFLSPLEIPSAALTTYQFGLALLTLLLVTDLEGVTDLGSDLRALVGVVVGLGLLGTGLAFLLYYFIVDRLGAVAASSATYLPPVVALAIGWLLVDEPIGWLDLVAVLLVLSGVAVLRVPVSRSAAG